MASGDAETKRARDARNEQIFTSRFTHLDQVIKPWLKKAAGERGANVIVDRDVSSASREAKEQYLLRNVENILSTALPKVPDTGTSSEKPHAATANTQTSAAPPLGDSLYAKTQFDKDNDSEQIRLLELLPSKNPSDVVIMTLFCVASPRDQEYDALSYTWGDPKDPKHTITLNGQPFDVGKNLYNALISIRGENRPRLLWVDAICINQKDDAEKAVQVAFMGAIYREAQKTVVFLGMPTEMSYPLFEFLKRDSRIENVTQENVEEIMDELEVDKTAVVASLIEFCDREWWTRVWVMQEYYLATRTPIWHVGSQFVEGEKLCRDVKGLAMAALRLASPFGHSQDLSAVFGNHTTSSLLDRLLKVCDGVLLRRETTPHNTPRLLFAKHGRKATVAKDYVYGVRELLEPHFRQVFVPDYDITQCNLFEKLAAWFFLMDGWGDMLWYYPFRRMCGPEGEIPGVKCEELPSWAPDFSRRPDHLVHEPEPPKFSSDDPKVVRCAIVDRILYIDGCYLDVIQEVIPMPKKGSSCFEVLQRMWRLDRIFCSNQRRASTADTYTDRDSRALLAWATTIRPATLPLVPRWRETESLLSPDLNKYVENLSASSKIMLDEAYAKAKASPESVEIQEWHKRTASAISTTHGRLVRGVANLHRFLSVEMECDFASACVFDLANLDSQLQSVGDSSDAQEGLGLIQSRYGPREVVYEDLIRNIQMNSDPDNPASFRDLVSVVRGIAKKIHHKVVDRINDPQPDTSDHTPPDSATKTAQFRELIEAQRARIKKLEEGDKIACGSFGTDSEKENHIQSLKKQVETAEGMIKLRTENEARCNQISGAKDGSWSRIDEERAAHFRGRQFFVTKTGLFGLACPGVEEVKVGDHVVLLDGLSFPIVARGCGDSRLAVVLWEDGDLLARGLGLKKFVIHRVRNGSSASGEEKIDVSVERTLDIICGEEVLKPSASRVTLAVVVRARRAWEVAWPCQPSWNRPWWSVLVWPNDSELAVLGGGGEAGISVCPWSLLCPGTTSSISNANSGYFNDENATCPINVIAQAFLHFMFKRSHPPFFHPSANSSGARSQLPSSTSPQPASSVTPVSSHTTTSSG
ncbi:heterokaryon incompatibility protein-domain-containing protein [Schizothecium vesticola]|uniref:Heterokaryon incompatibility protein-domain-containing protein n=1 Tax=Schizothecium vesticola TaxID=314040 RepID=A0AA40F2S3_9PEZI|nr:heterokaryon incompatibility protein-domain-containing protein [Schizothecium vesticola]